MLPVANQSIFQVRTPATRHILHLRLHVYLTTSISNSTSASPHLSVSNPISNPISNSNMATITSLARLRLCVPLTQRAMPSSSPCWRQSRVWAAFPKSRTLRTTPVSNGPAAPGQRSEESRNFEERLSDCEDRLIVCEEVAGNREERIRFLETHSECRTKARLRDHRPGQHDRQCIQNFSNCQAYDFEPFGNARLCLQRIDLSESPQYPVGS